MQKLKVGDRVRYVGPNEKYAEILEGCLGTVINLTPSHVKVEWDNGVKAISAGLLYYTLTKVEKEKEMTKDTLYEIKRGDQTLFGTKLAVNSQGQWVMEVKGSGEVVAVDKNTVFEVVPYTISVQYQEGGTVYEYLNEKRDLEVGDFFINSATYGGANNGAYQIGRVIAVDTKAKKATSEIKYFKKL